MREEGEEGTRGGLWETSREAGTPFFGERQRKRIFTIVIDLH
jgi:hypothetical protein